MSSAAVCVGRRVTVQKDQKRIHHVHTIFHPSFTAGRHRAWLLPRHAQSRLGKGVDRMRDDSPPNFHVFFVSLFGPSFLSVGCIVYNLSAAFLSWLIIGFRLTKRPRELFFWFPPPPPPPMIPFVGQLCCGGVVALCVCVCVCV